MIYQFLVQGSASDPYLVEFQITKSKFKVTCTCPAGEKKILCKHITSILEGEISTNLNGDVDKIPKILNAFNDAEVGNTYSALLSISNEIEILKKEMNNRKKQVARMFYN